MQAMQNCQWCICYKRDEKDRKEKKEISKVTHYY